MAELPTVLSETKLSNSFMSETIQICVVSRDYKRTMAGYVKAGIGPWRIYRYRGESKIKNTRYRGAAETFSMVVCLAWTGKMMWEIIEPLDGPTIYKDFLEEHGEGVQHVAVACDALAYDEQVEEFEARGFPVVQSGLVKDSISFHYFGTEPTLATSFEIFTMSADMTLPEPDEWYPAPPPGH